MRVEWIKCDGGQWCHFYKTDLESLTGIEGLYVIFYPGRVLKVGQGNVAERIAAERADQAIEPYKNEGLYFTCASLPADFRDGAEKSLIDDLEPILGDRFPDRKPFYVNPPDFYEPRP